jgi:hypothetical protein
MKAAIPMNAIPPATDKPTIVDVLTPLLSLSSLSSAPGVVLGEADELVAPVAGTVTMTVIDSPSSFVETNADVVKAVLVGFPAGGGVILLLGLDGPDGGGEDVEAGGVDDGVEDGAADVELGVVEVVGGVDEDVGAALLDVCELGVVEDPAEDPPSDVRSPGPGPRRPKSRGTIYCFSDVSRRLYRGTSVNMRRHETHARRTRHRVGVKGLSIELGERN